MSKVYSDTSIIEHEGITLFKRFCLGSKIFAQGIKESDKDQFWDGSLHIYKTMGDTRKSNHDFEVRVQVKSIKEIYSENLNQSYLKYDIESVDLEAYLKGGGVMFIVILLDESHNFSVYSRALIQSTIDKIINSKPNQKTHRVKIFRKADNIQFYNDCIFFHRNQIKQSLSNLSVHIETSKINKEQIEVDYSQMFNGTGTMPNIDDVILYVRKEDNSIVHLNNAKLVSAELQSDEIRVDNMIYDLKVIELVEEFGSKLIISKGLITFNLVEVSMTSDIGVLENCNNILDFVYKIYFLNNIIQGSFIQTIDYSFRYDLSNENLVSVVDELIKIVDAHKIRKQHSLLFSRLDERLQELRVYALKNQK